MNHTKINISKMAATALQFKTEILLVAANVIYNGNITTLIYYVGFGISVFTFSPLCIVFTSSVVVCMGNTVITGECFSRVGSITVAIQHNYTSFNRSFIFRGVPPSGMQTVCLSNGIRFIRLSDPAHGIVTLNCTQNSARGWWGVGGSRGRG